MGKSFSLKKMRLYFEDLKNNRKNQEFTTYEKINIYNISLLTKNFYKKLYFSYNFNVN